MEVIRSEADELFLLRGRFCEKHRQIPEDAEHVRCMNCTMIAAREYRDKVIRERVHLEVEAMGAKRQLEEERDRNEAYRMEIVRLERENATLKVKMDTLEHDTMALRDEVAKALRESPLTKEIDKLRNDRMRLHLDLNKLVVDILDLKKKYGIAE